MPKDINLGVTLDVASFAERFDQAVHLLHYDEPMKVIGHGH